jgi:hypothetical protein
MIFMSRKAISTARERIVSFEDVKGDDDAAKRLRELMAGGNYLEEDFERESPDTRALVLPGDARTVNGDRVVVLLVKDRYDASCEDVAVVCKPLRSVRKNPEPRPRVDDRIGAMPKLPTLADLSTPSAPAPRNVAAAVVEAGARAQEVVRESVDPPRTSTRQRKSSRAAPSRVLSPGMSRGAALLRNELLKRGLSVKEAAEQFGVSSWQITRWQTGHQLPDIRQATTLERAAGIPMRAWSEQL